MDFIHIKQNRHERRRQEAYKRWGGSKRQRAQKWTPPVSVRRGVTRLLKSMKGNKAVQDKVLAGDLDRFLERG